MHYEMFAFTEGELVTVGRGLVSEKCIGFGSIPAGTRLVQAPT